MTVAVETDAQSVDPRFAVDAASSRIADLLHLGLTSDDGAGGRRPALASAWEAPDETTLVFHLRRDFRFPDGTAVTARDVAATYAAILDPATASPKRAALAALDGVDAADDATVVFRLRRPFPPILDATGIGVLPAARARDGGEVGDGAGPFRLVRRDPGERLMLARNPGWPGPPPSVGSIEFRVVPDPLVRVLELVRGSVDLTQDPPDPAVLPWLDARREVRVLRRPGTSFAYLAVNCADRWLAQRRVRQAIALALDRAALLALVQGDAGRLANGMLAPEHWAWAPAPALRHDPARARRLLDRAGLVDPDGDGPRPRLTLTYKTTGIGPRRRLAEAVQAQLGAVGIAVDVRTYEWATLFADVRAGRFDLASLAWVGIGDPDLYFLTTHSTMVPPAGYNRGRFTSPVMDRLTAAARRTTDPALRRRLYARIQRRAARELPVVPLWWEDRIAIAGARLEGFVPAASGALDGLLTARLR